MVLPYLVIYLTTKIKISAASAGLVLAFYGAGALITAPFVGKLSDRIGSLRVMKISLIATGFMLFLYSFVQNFYLILAVTLIWSVISEAFRPANLSLISMETSAEQRKTAFALNRLAINLGMSIGPVIGGFLSVISFSFLFYVNGTTSILAGIFLITTNFESAKEKELVEKIPHAETNAKRHKLFSILSDKKALLFMLSIIPVNMVFFQFIGALPLYVVQYLKVPTSTFGILMSVNTILIILIEVPLNNAMANWDDRKALALGALLCGLGFGAMIVSESIWFIVLTIIVWTFGEMVFFPSSASYTAIISPDERRGEYMGYYQMTFSLALMLGPWIGTTVLDSFGPEILWSGAFFLSLISTAAFLKLKKKSE